VAGYEIVGRSGFNYPIKSILRQSFAAVSKESFFQPSDASMPAFGLEIGLASSRLAVDSGEAAYTIEVDAEVCDHRGNTVETLHAKAATSSTFDGKNTPGAVWAGCLSVSRSIVRQLQASRKLPALPSPKTATYRVQLKLADMALNVLEIARDSGRGAKSLQPSSSRCLDKLVAGRKSLLASKRVAVLGNDKVRPYIEMAIKDHPARLRLVDRTALQALIGERSMERITRDPSAVSGMKIEGIDYFVIGELSVERD
jgi:hypothetical protein